MTTKYRLRTYFSTLSEATAANRVLREGELWTERDAVTGHSTGQRKVGDGVTEFVDLPFEPSAATSTAASVTFTPAGTIVATNVQAAVEELDGDARMSDARTPTAHAASHGSGGSDPLTLAQSQVTGLGTALAGKEAAGAAAAAVTAHEGAADPHAQYLTETEGDGRYRQTATALTDADIPAGIARDSEVTAAIGAHEAAADPHPGYLTAAEGNAAYATTAQGALADTAVQPGDLATVATTGAYADLSGSPTLGSLASLSALGPITSAGAIGTTSGLPIITGASGVLQAGAFGTTAGTFAQGNDSRFHDSVTLGPSISPVFSISGQVLSAVDHGADRLLFWDDSAGTLAPLTCGTNLSITGTTLNAAGVGTNLSIANRGTTTLDVASDTGTDATIPAATTSLTGLLTSADKTKLDGVATGATANATDAALRDRATHTGTQALGTISGLGTGVATALEINTGSAGAPVLFNGAGGTPSSITLTNGSSLPWGAGVTGKPTTLSGYGITDAQPLDADLTSIAALTTTTFGRQFLDRADAAAGRTHLGLGTAATSAASAFASSGAVTGSGLTMATAQLLGRSTASTGAVEEITVGSGLSLSGGTLTATGGGGSPGGGTTQVQYNNAGAFAGAANVEINSDNLQLTAPSSAPAAAEASSLLVYPVSNANRFMLAMKGPTGHAITLQPSLFGNNIMMFFPQSGSTGTGSNAFQAAWTSSGTVSHPTMTITNLHTRMRRTSYNNVATTTNQQIGVRRNTASDMAYVRGNAADVGGFFFFTRFSVGLYPASTIRLFAGLQGAGATTSVCTSDTVANHTVGLWHDTTDPSSGSGAFNFVTRNGTTTTKTAINIANAIAAATVYDWMMYCAPNGSEVFYRLDDLTNNVTYTGSSTTTLPGNTNYMSPQVQMSNGTAHVTSNTVVLALAQIYVESVF